MPTQFETQVRPALEEWIDTRPQHEAAYLRQLFQQESGYTPHAESGTGATGLGQITRGTWNDIVTFARRNIPEEELPSDLDYPTLEQSNSYDLYAKRPFANAWASWANIKRLESIALDGINSKRIRASDENVPAGTLLDAVSGDPRQWAMIVGAGHKDGQSRMNLFTDENGIFSTAPAREFYRERRQQFADSARRFATQADTLRAEGDEAGAEEAERRARRLSTSDSTGHVFGFSDRLATAVADAQGLPPLEFEAEELDDFIELRAPGHTTDNPAVQRFAQAREIIQNTQAAPEVAAAASRPPPNPLESLFGRTIEALVPSAQAAEAPTLLNLGEQTQPDALSEASNDSTEESSQVLPGVATQAAQAQPGQAANTAGAPTPTLLTGATPVSDAAQAQGSIAQAQATAADILDAQTRAEQDILARSTADNLEAVNSLINNTINPAGISPEQFDARAGAINQAVGNRANQLNEQNALRTLAGIRSPVALPDGSANLAALENNSITADNAGDFLRSLNVAPTATDLSQGNVGRISSTLNAQITGQNQRDADTDIGQIIAGSDPLLADQLSGVADITRGIDLNRAIALQQTQRLVQDQNIENAITQGAQLATEQLVDARETSTNPIGLSPAIRRALEVGLRERSRGTSLSQDPASFPSLLDFNFGLPVLQ